MRIGIGGGAFGVRGGISNRGVGVGLGPLSVGTGWGRRSRRSSGDDGFISFCIFAFGVFILVAWPYLLGTWFAVQAGAANPSPARSLVGWIFEIAYIAGLIACLLLTQEKRAERAADARQAQADLIASGTVYETRAGRSVAYRHGTCTVNHRTWETAARCRYG